AQAVLRTLEREFPDYSYKEAALNPTNPADRATPWEVDVIQAFKRNPNLTQFVGLRDTPTGPFLTFARPFRLTDKACLDCHSTPAAAPATMIDLYGKSNGFGWQLCDVIGAQIVSVPMSLALRRARAREPIAARFHGGAGRAVRGDAGGAQRAAALCHPETHPTHHAAGWRRRRRQVRRPGIPSQGQG